VNKWQKWNYQTNGAKRSEICFLQSANNPLQLSFLGALCYVVNISLPESVTWQFDSVHAIELSIRFNTLPPNLWSRELMNVIPLLNQIWTWNCGGEQVYEMGRKRIESDSFLSPNKHVESQVWMCFRNDRKRQCWEYWMTFEGLWNANFEGSMEVGFTVRGGWWSGEFAPRSPLHSGRASLGQYQSLLS
jgi:hypothetical protein